MKHEPPVGPAPAKVLGRRPTGRSPIPRTGSHLLFGDMSDGTKVGEKTLFWCTVLTLVGSFAFLSSVIIGVLLVAIPFGFSEVVSSPHLIIRIVLAFSSTIGLLIGFIALLRRFRWARAVLLPSSICLLVAFSMVTVGRRTQPLLWWPIVFLGIAEVILALLGPRLAYLAD